MPGHELRERGIAGHWNTGQVDRPSVHQGQPPAGLIHDPRTTTLATRVLLWATRLKLTPRTA